MDGFPSGTALAELDRAQGDIGHDPNEWQAARERLAAWDWSDFVAGRDSEGTRNVRDWLDDNARDYVESMFRGGDYHRAACWELQRNALAWLAETMDDDRIRAEVWL